MGVRYTHLGYKLGNADLCIFVLTCRQLAYRLGDGVFCPWGSGERDAGSSHGSVTCNLKFLPGLERCSLLAQLARQSKRIERHQCFTAAFWSFVTLKQCQSRNQSLQS